MSTSGYLSLSTPVLLLSGENTRRWCNGMFSNNFRAMKPQQHHRSAICDDRGRVQGLLDTICISDNDFLCVLDGLSLETFSKRFQMYMILDDIEMEEYTPSVLHLFGPEATDWLNTLGLPIPEQGTAIQHENLWVQHRSRLRDTIGFDIISASEEADVLNALLQQLQALQAPTNTQTFEDLRIQTGTPRYPQDFTDKSFIHEYQLETELCSFNKGCYVGQEIINRMDIKQLASKRLLVVTVEGRCTLGASILFEDKPVGTLTSLDSSGTTGLALLKKKVWDIATPLQVEGSEGTVQIQH